MDIPAGEFREIMSDQFWCSKKGGIKDPDDGCLYVLEGSAEKGPWYNARQFTNDQIAKWAFHGWIRFMEIEVK